MSRHKVLIISVNECLKPPFSPIYPMGALFIAKQLESKYQVRIMNLEFYDVPKFQKAFKQFNPDIVLVSVRNRINFTAKLKSVITFIKKQKKEFFVGGTAVTIYPEYTQDYLKISSKQIITGEFESMMHSIFPKVSSTHKVEKMKMPDGSFMNYTEKEIIQNREFGIESRRGCHFNCIYCINHLLGGKKIKKRRISTVIKNICDLYSHGISNFFFVDAVFNYPRDYGYNLCVALSKKNLKARFGGYIIPLNVIDKEVEIWEKINLRVSLGADGISEKALKSWNKPFTNKELLHVLKILKKHKINYIFNLMLGGPGQTLSDVKKELFLLERINPPQAIIAVGAFESPRLREISAGIKRKDLPENIFVSPLINIRELTKLINSKIHLYKKKKWIIKSLTRKFKE